MKAKDYNKMRLLSREEAQLRLAKIRAEMHASDMSAMLVTDNANKFYITGRVFAGYIYLPYNGLPIYFVQRPVELQGDGVVYIRKPEQISETLGLNVPESLGLELDTLSYSSAERLKKIFPQSRLMNASKVMRKVRSVKTPAEIEKLRFSGIKQMRVYSRIPSFFRPGMTDIELQVEIERESRLEGCLGQFRISGDSMEIYMGNVLVGENADSASPYDFAMGGRGLDPSLPVGASGEEIVNGKTVMVDMNGDYNGYMTDMTRVYAPSKLPELALEAHQCSIDIHHALCHMMETGMEAKVLFEHAEKMVKDRHLDRYFMGHRQKAGFIGHGVGIEINELPVISPRSRDLISPGNVIALEPKFVIPHVGAVGIENTYYIKGDSVECLTAAPEEIIYFD